MIIQRWVVPSVFSLTIATQPKFSLASSLFMIVFGITFGAMGCVRNTRLIGALTSRKRPGVPISPIGRVIAVAIGLVFLIAGIQGLIS